MKVVQLQLEGLQYKKTKRNHPAVVLQPRLYTVSLQVGLSVLQRLHANIEHPKLSDTSSANWSDCNLWIACISISWGSNEH